MFLLLTILQMLLYHFKGCIIMADYACQNGNNLFIYCPLIFCILPCHTQKYVPLPWTWVKFYDGLIYHKWCHMTPMRDLNRCPRFCLTRSWDTPPWNVAAMLWGSPGDTAESVCRCSSQQPVSTASLVLGDSSDGPSLQPLSHSSWSQAEQGSGPWRTLSKSQIYEQNACLC